MCVSVFHPSLFSSKPHNIDIALSVCLLLIHHHGTGDLLDAKHPGLLCLTIASDHLYSSWNRKLFLANCPNRLAEPFFEFEVLLCTCLLHPLLHLPSELEDMADYQSSICSPWFERWGAAWNIVDFSVSKVVSCSNHSFWLKNLHPSCPLKQCNGQVLPCFF